MAKTNFSVFDLLDLPDIDRAIVLYISRHGICNSDELSNRLEKEVGEVQSALKRLIDQERLQVNSFGNYQVVLGRIQPKTTLPPQIWPALLTSGREYSETEIAVLRTAIPMLQFARARLSEFSDHGSGHAMRVKSYATEFGYLLELNDKERFLLRSSALFHDIGNVVDRATHHLISEETVLNLYTNGKLPMDLNEAVLIGLLCRWHRKEYNPDQIDVLNGEVIRTGLLASILRVSDAMDIDHRRSDYDEKFRSVLEFFYPQEMPYWTSLENILGVRIVAGAETEIQIFVDGPDKGNIQIKMLQGDLASTPLPWKTRPIYLGTEDDPPASIPNDTEINKKALVIFPFDANNLIMAALSQKHLKDAGHPVELVCYPDTPNGPDWLWNEFLSELDTEEVSKIILIGERFLGTVTPRMSYLISQWSDEEIQVSFINRHESNWHRLPMLVGLGAEIILGGDWCYFWGEDIQIEDFFWAKIASQCSRDPTQAQVIITQEEQEVADGLLDVVYEAVNQPGISDTRSWQKLAQGIIDRILANDRQYFQHRAENFNNKVSELAQNAQREGRVLKFYFSAETRTDMLYWALEKSIESHIETQARRLTFTSPYAIAHWSSNGQMEILAINHWRDEESIPIRFLYPDHLIQKPAGNESTLHFRVTEEHAEEVIRELTKACNKTENI